jgi:hypothetical protein
MSRKRGKLKTQPFLTTSAGGNLSLGCAAKYRSLTCIKQADSLGKRDRTTIEAKQNTLASH